MSAESPTQLTPEPTELPTRGENFYLHALLGAVVTFFTAIIPFSPVIGGAVAGYLHAEGTDRGIRVGAVSGLMASLPLVAIFLLLFTVMSIGSLVTGEVAGPVFVIAIVGITFVLGALYTVGLSAAGGYLGASYAESKAEKLAAEATHATHEDEQSIETEPLDSDESIPSDDESTATSDEEN
ncbi:MULTISPECIES: DUF5518 domain-containing protein [Haloferax]|uniref:DUF5518 domain-containing protein n=1 Tax=Haloferax TaxID=2251 RepID=UPI00177FA3AC|nr:MULTISPECIES: DUF5518 domain-containing protein [Haloferax]